MQRPWAVRVTAVSLFIAASVANVATAGTRSRVEESNFASLHAPSRSGAPLRIANLPLVERAETIVLEEFDVLAPNAVIEVFDGEGKPERVKPQPMRQFRGRVEGDPQSIVYLAVTRGSRLDGLIITRDRKFSLWSGPRKEVFVEEVAGADAESHGFVCDVEKLKISETAQGLPKSIAASELNARTTAAPTGTQKTMLNLAIESDTALYTNFSSNIANVETFLRNLVGAMSTIYSRDLNTEVRIPYLGMHTTTDPFAVNPGQSGQWNGNTVTWNTSMAMYEFGDRWHNSPPSSVARSAAALISGQSQLSGVAWLQRTCLGDFQCNNNCGDANANGHWAGAYSYNGGIGTTAANRTVPDPNALANFGAPGSGYWPLLELSHEFGHNVQSGHTHCVTLDAPDQATYGRTYVDNCYSGECYNGVTGLPADGAGGRGTIMSYCHLLAGGGNNTRFTFGQANEASHEVVDDMRARLDTITPAGLSAITAPSSVPEGVSGQAASVTNTAGLTFDWTITNGTFSNGLTTITGASVTFTGTTTPVTLKVVATNSSGCSISDTKSVTVGASVNPPTNVAATASSTSTVSVTWTTAAGAASYNVYRSTDGTTYTLAGNVAGPPFGDTGRSANTAYLYKVRSVSGGESTDSNRDFAVTIAFTDPTITTQATTIKAAHFTELRTAVNALRTLNGGQSAFGFTDPVLSSSVVAKVLHMTELRTQLNTVRTALGFSTLAFTDTVTSASTLVQKVHMDELRAGVQ